MPNGGKAVEPDAAWRSLGGVVAKTVSVATHLHVTGIDLNHSNSLAGWVISEHLRTECQRFHSAIG